MPLRASLFAALACAAAASRAFTLAPAALCPEQAVHNVSMSAWGGSVIEVPEDPVWRFHMYNGVSGRARGRGAPVARAAARAGRTECAHGGRALTARPPSRRSPPQIYTRGCGVNYWRGNSAVVHLVARTPAGPFTYADEALPLWHTNPQVVRDPKSGLFVLFAIGQSVDRANWTECDCSKPTPCPPGAPPNPDLAGVIDVHSSASPYGPWAPLVINGSTVAMHGTNPAPVFLANGTLVLGINSEGTHVAVVNDWRAGPYARNPTGTLPNVPDVWYEDPFLWQSPPPAARWRQLVHQYPVANGRPAPQFATGGYGDNGDAGDVFAPWTFGGTADPAYTNNVTYADGSTQTLRRRERPKLLFAADGTAWLYTAAQSPLNASRDFSFTLVQQVLAFPE